MTFDKYQEETAKTAIYKPAVALLYLSTGLSSEVGEVLGKIAKCYRDKDGIISDRDRMDIKKELGDILWFVSELATYFGYTLNDVADCNVEKLRDRQSRGALGGSGDNR